MCVYRAREIEPREGSGKTLGPTLGARAKKARYIRRLGKESSAEVHVHTKVIPSSVKPGSCIRKVIATAAAAAAAAVYQSYRRVRD